MYKSRERALPSPTYMSEEQMGQHLPDMSPTNYHLYTPPRPSRLRQCITNDNDDDESSDLRDHATATYLQDLRSQRASRPSGSRPPPPSKFASLRRTETAPVDTQKTTSDPPKTTRDPPKTTSDDRPSLQKSDSMPIMPAAQRLLSHRRAELDLRAKSPFAGRPLARPPSATPPETSPKLEPSKELRRPTSMYVENGTRWMEKQEAKSLRMALEDMDLKDEKKVHSDAQDEAAELVWKHRFPAAAKAKEDAPFANPDLSKDYHKHLRRGSYQRSYTQDPISRTDSRTESRGSERPANDIITMNKRTSIDNHRKVSPPAASISTRKTRTPSGKTYGALADSVADDVANAHRRTSSGSKRIMSGEKKMYMHPNDKIFEDPSEQQPPALSPPARMAVVEEQPVKPSITPVQPATSFAARKNPFARVRLQQEKLTHSTSAPVLPTTGNKFNRVEIQRNPPSQSRNAWYTSNDSLPPTPPSSRDQDAEEASPTKDGKEIRGDDIRAATSKQRKDRSPNLPQPTLVSGKPGRPIVSFQPGRSTDVVLEEVHSSSASEPTKSSPTSRFAPRPTPSPPAINIPSISLDDVVKSPIPTINIPDEPTVPSIVLPEEPDFADPGFTTPPAININPPAINISTPTINIDTPTSPSKSHQRPLPTRPQPHHAATSPLPKSTPHYTPSTRPSGALCAHCALPIAGRILSAGGERFHPHCFICHECHTNLELVAFYPEPDTARTERLYNPDQDQESSDPSPRFFCHLDYHELFSPRCKSCKTPIEGRIVSACGSTYHEGHFFCAQCGDPFDAKTPFVEKDGYAWCVGCHTNRFSGKCRGCRKPVTGTVVRALGAEWCVGCFVCVECHGDFEDGRYFLRGESEDPVCVKCEERRLKA